MSRIYQVNRTARVDRNGSSLIAVLSVQIQNRIILKELRRFSWTLIGLLVRARTPEISVR